jgi:hypothetical protein
MDVYCRGMKNPFFRLTGVIVLAGWTVFAIAAVPATTQAEVARLLQALGDSDCRFQRNGGWYDAASARAHLQWKYDWMVRRDLVTDTEQFIEQAAAKSSRSGRAYRVSCPGQPEQDSLGWFQAKLREIRAGAR